jgi:uncharacterized protein (DUF58 family)
VLLLALASLLLRGGERVRLVAPGGRSVSGRVGLERLAEGLEGLAGEELPGAVGLPRFARVVLIGDFLGPLDEIRDCVGAMAGVPVSGHVLQVLDPAEALLPYRGRVRFHGTEREAATVVPRVEGVRAAYAARLAEQQAGLAAIAAAAGWGFAVHRTDHPAEAALLGLYAALAPEAGRR